MISSSNKALSQLQEVERVLLLAKKELSLQIIDFFKKIESVIQKHEIQANLMTRLNAKTARLNH